MPSISKRDIDRAIADYDQAIRLNPRFAIAYNNRGNAYDDKGDPTAPSPTTTRPCAPTRTTPRPIYNRGIAWRRKGDLDRAIADYDQAIRLNPTAAAYNNRGSAWHAKGENERAIADLNRRSGSIRARPTPTSIAATPSASGSILSGAIADYTRAIELSPTAALAYYNRAWAHYLAGENVEAQADVDRAIEINAHSASAFSTRGLIRERLGDTAGAIADFRKALGDRSGVPAAGRRFAPAQSRPGREPITADARQQPPRPYDRIVPLIVAVSLFMENMDSTVIATSLPAIAQALGTNPLAFKLAVTSYLLSLAICIPASGWIADRFGARNVFRLAIGVFVLGSIGCALSHSLEEFVLARIVQGMGGAMMTPVGRLIMRAQHRQARFWSTPCRC